MQMNASKLRLYHRLQVAAHAMRKSADRAISDAAELTTAQAAVLTVVAAGETVTQRDVAVALRHNESAVTAMVSRLLKLEFLERMRSDTDSRAWHLRVSTAGQAALRASRTSFASVNARIEGALSQQEMERLADYLDRLTRAFEDRSA
jgi:MarR family transcriptional regulator, organic hydroperoxide resistance regulator